MRTATGPVKVRRRRESVATACLALLVPLLPADAAPPDPSLLLWLPFDQTSGMVAADASVHALEAETENVRFVTGAFGTAARFGGTNSFIDLPPVPGLDGATQFTLSAWVTWEGSGRYPNLLTTRNWSPGGFMLFVSDNTCSFRMGRPHHRAGVAGESWAETGVPLLHSLPRRQWTHLGVVFDRPSIRAYVNGKPAGEGSWPYPVQADSLRIGGWSGPISHNGLIDDLRIYNRPLSAAEVAGLASDPARTRADYMPVDEPVPPPTAVFENRHARLVVDTAGRIASLVNRRTGRELLARPQELVSARLRDGRQTRSQKAFRERDNLVFEFPQQRGRVVLDIDTHRDFFAIAIRSLTVTNVESLTFFNVPAAPAAYRGGMANMLSDDTDAVCLRGYDLAVELSVGGRPPELRAWTTADRGLTGWRAGLAAGARADLPDMLRAMTEHAGVPASRLGGPWSLGAEANRGSYLFADLSRASTDDWIELARRGGFETLHLHGWWDTLGHYGVNTNLFPNGLADLKDTVDRIHGAGLKAGLHTLTACIEPRDAWVAPEASPHLIAFDRYTLAEPLSATAAVIRVNEKPSARHDLVFTYMGNGNALRIGTEIVQYGGLLSSNPPYAFTQCRRGAFGTRPAAHPAGALVDYLQQRYIAFYPEPDSPLAGDLADRIAHVFNACRFDQIYFDGSEGMMNRYGIDAMRHAIFKRLRGDPLVEASCHGAHNWWFHSRLGAWDHPVWAAKRFHDKHVESAAAHRRADLLEPQMGWWAPRGPSPQARGHFLDEMEYFAAKNLGLDTAMSIQGVNVTRAPLPAYIEDQITLLGWYERLRLARYFDSQTVARVAAAGDEFRLRQNREGLWQFTPVRMSSRRFAAEDLGPVSWTLRNDFDDQPLSARIEALYAAAPYDATNRRCVTEYADLSAFKTDTASAALSIRLAAEDADTRGGPRNLRLLAENRGDSRRGAWTRASLAFPAPYLDLSGAGAFGLWIKGDGKGALLNIQFATPREHMHALSDHYVTLDFKGWRYVELLVRERDVGRMTDYVWPYGGAYDIHRNPLDLAHISGLNLYLNDLPARESCEAIVGPIMALPVRRADIRNPSLSANGRTVTVPFVMKSGDFLDVESDGLCIHRNERGDIVGRSRPAPSAAWPQVRRGDNAIAFDGSRPASDGFRAEVTVIAAGTPFGSPNPPRRIDGSRLDREYEMIRSIHAPFGDENAWEVRVRPGETATLEIELRGGMTNPVLDIGGRAIRFPVALKTGQRLICRDRREWSVLDVSRTPLSRGRLPERVPTLKGGSTRIVFSCDAGDRAEVRLVKVYE